MFSTYAGSRLFAKLSPEYILKPVITHPPSSGYYHLTFAVKDVDLISQGACTF